MNSFFVHDIIIITNFHGNISYAGKKVKLFLFTEGYCSHPGQSLSYDFDK
jgi:hypothetical protein